MQIDLARAGRELKLLRHVGNQLRHCEPLALGFNTAVFKSRQLKQLLRKMTDLLPLTQRGGEILLMLLRRQGGGFERQGFEIAQQRGERRAEIVRNIGDKLTTLTIAVGQPIPLLGDFARQLDKAVAQDRHFIFCRRVRRLSRQQPDGAYAVLLQPGDLHRQLFDRARNPVPDQQPCQQPKQRDPQQRPQDGTPQRLVPGHFRQGV
ncbi:Uncharacterised protein [Klebsiella pneumoniae]|nr:Uncharacterised protein [Klebsiella pneumoniae]